MHGEKMTFVDGLVAIAVILGFIYIIVVKMKQKNRGKAILGWTKDNFHPKDLFYKSKEKTKEQKNQLWLEKRSTI